MNKKPANPPAFPIPVTSGMTLRDYFAGQALRSLRLPHIDSKPDIEEMGIADWSARTAYAFADAMLRARKS